MSCPLCHYPKCATLDSRGYHDADVVRRRRECISCGYRFTTYEQVIIRGDIVVSKRDGNREVFKLSKVENSLRMALAKRNVTPERIERIAQAVAETIDFGADGAAGKTARGHYRLVTSAHIGQLVMESLRELDPVAYVRYASIHRRFHCLADYQRLLDTLA